MMDHSALESSIVLQSSICWIIKTNDSIRYTHYSINNSVWLFIPLVTTFGKSNGVSLGIHNQPQCIEIVGNKNGIQWANYQRFWEDTGDIIKHWKSVGYTQRNDINSYIHIYNLGNRLCCKVTMTFDNWSLKQITLVMTSMS